MYTCLIRERKWNFNAYNLSKRRKCVLSASALFGVLEDRNLSHSIVIVIEANGAKGHPTLKNLTGKNLKLVTKR